METARRVDNHDIAKRIDSITHAFFCDLDWILPFASIYAHADFITQRLQLIGCSGTIYVTCAQKRAMILLFKKKGKLGSSRGFARTLQTNKHDHVRNATGKLEWLAFFTHKSRKLIENDLHYILRRRKRIKDLRGKATLFSAFGEFLYHFEVNIGLK